MKMKKMIIVLYGVLLTQVLSAQISLLDSAKNELYRINKVFDSSRYLGFDLNILYKGDSIETSQLSGNYILNRKNLYYNMGGNQYVQTDSFSYTIYGDEKMMIVTKNFLPENSDVFPLKTFVDSVIQYYGTAYRIAIAPMSPDSSNYRKAITFSDTSSGSNVLPYKMFYIEYDENSYYPLTMAMQRQEVSVSNPGGTGQPSVIKILSTKLSMDFSNYKIYTQTEIFNDNQYTIYNRQRKIYEPAEKYKEYRFITSGFENEDEDAQYYREVPFGGN